MKPIGPLMVEHRLFERMLAVLKGQLEAMRRGDLDLLLMTEVLDFFGTYADLNHHGKEEDILFKTLAEKPLTPELRTMMEGLIADHARARELMGSVSNGLARLVRGDHSAVVAMEAVITEVLRLYHIHIVKEDKEFFFPILSYLSKEEQDKMLADFMEFDSALLHRKYRTMVERLERRP